MSTFSFVQQDNYWILTYSDGRMGYVPRNSEMSVRTDGSVVLGRHTLRWDKCTNTGISSQSALVDEFMRTNPSSRVEDRVGTFMSVPDRVYGADSFSVRKFGRNPDVDTDTLPEDVWAVGGTFNFQTSASAIRVRLGGNVADTVAGAGARSVHVEGIDGNGAVVSESIELAGASASAATTQTFLRVNRAFIEEVGTYGTSNAGTIILETTGGTTVAQLAVGFGQTQMAFYTVPMGYTGYLTSYEITVDTDANNRSAFLQLMQRADVATTSGSGMKAFRVISNWEGVKGTISEKLDAPIRLSAMTDVWFRVTALEQSNTAISVSFTLVMIKDAPTA